MARYKPGSIVVIENIPYLIKETAFTGEECCAKCDRNPRSCARFIDPLTDKFASCATLFGGNTCLKKLKGGI